MQQNFHPRRNKKTAGNSPEELFGFLPKFKIEVQKSVVPRKHENYEKHSRGLPCDWGGAKPPESGLEEVNSISNT